MLMGAVSSCCKSEIHEDSELVLLNKTVDEAPQARHVNLSLDKINEYRVKLQSYLPAQLILHNSTHMDCRLSIDYEHDTLLISSATKARAIPIKFVACVLSSAQQLSQVECAQPLTEMEKLCALHLSITNTCLLLKFESEEAASAFIYILQSIIKDLKSA